jgi:uncharacterized repeat protein (TIGR01451 family)
MSFGTRSFVRRALPATLALAVAFVLQLGGGFGQSLPDLQLVVSPGGFLESATTGIARPRLSQTVIQALLPARGPFTFPAPYGTSAVRLTNGTDCGGSDCVFPIGYSYWRNINNHAGSNEMLIFLGLNQSRGGSGPTLFSYNKTTDQVTKVGPLFDPSSAKSSGSGEGWYFSGTQPTKIYVDDGPRMLRYDVLTRQSQTIFDVTTQFGADKILWQMHSSDDDRVHSATLRTNTTWEMLGCVVYHEDTRQFQYFPKIGDFNECHVDKSGRWLMSLEDVDGRYDLEMRIFDLTNGSERLVWDQDGAVGHADMGHGYVIGSDNWNSLSNAVFLWDFSNDPLSGRMVSHNTDWSAPAPNHFAHGNARPGVPSAQQYACGSGASRANAVWGNEIICFRLDGSMDVLIVAPVMTDLDAAGGGDDYSKLPKGNLDVTGQYFIWTSNAGGSRLDAFIVKVPAQLLVGGSGEPAPPTLSVTDAPDPVAAGGTITYTLTYSNSGTTNLTGVVIQDRLPSDTSFVSATAGGALSNGLVTWTIGALSAGASGSVQMTVRVAASLPAGSVITHGACSIASNETGSVTGPPITTTVAAASTPAITTVVETGTGSIFVLQPGALTIRVEGTNFQSGAVVSLGPDISVGTASLTGTGRLTVAITVASTASLGARTVTVTNPDSSSGSRAAALTVVRTADINRDCRIDGGDLNLLARAWNTRRAEPGFNAAAELDGDDYVGPLDLTIFAEYFGQRLAVCP